MKKFEDLTDEEKESNNQFEKSQIIKKYLNERYEKPSSKATRKAELKEFFCFIKTEPEKYLQDARLIFVEKEKTEYLINIENDIRSYKHYLNTKAISRSGRKFSPLHIRNCISSLKSLLDRYNIILSNHYWKTIKNGNDSEISIKRSPEPKDLAKILHHADSRGKALALIAATSGNRLGETVAIKLDDLRLDYEYPRYEIHYEDSKNKKIAKKRMSPEAKDATIEYIKQREKYLRTSIKRNKYKKNLTEKEINNLIKTEPKLFPISKKETNTIWTNILERAGKPYNEKDPKTNRYVYGFHSLRRFFRNEFERYDSNKAKFFMNQETQSTKAYRDWSEERIDEEYSKGVKYLLIYKKAIDTDIRIKQLRNEVTQLKNKIEEKDDTITDQNLNLKLRADSLIGKEKQIGNITEEKKGYQFQLANIHIKQCFFMNNTKKFVEIMTKYKNNPDKIISEQNKLYTDWQNSNKCEDDLMEYFFNRRKVLKNKLK